MAQFFYDAQVRRYLIQFSKLFSLFYVTRGLDPDGNPILQRVPVMYGDQSRNVATIIANNSQSTLPSAPIATYWITSIDYNQSWMQSPTFVEKVQVRQRAYDEVTKTYDTVQGQAFTVERLMPVPYTLKMQVDFWTTNTQQKHELFEQIGCLFNPSLEIQNDDNYLDWTSLSVVYQDGLTWSSRTIPQGTANPIDIMTWRFSMPIWISAPAKLKRMGVIYKIINSIRQGSTLQDMQDDELLLGTRQKVNPYGYKLLFIDNTLQLLPDDQPFTPTNSALELPENPDTAVYWSALLNMYGVVRPGISQIWLQNEYMDTDIVGTIEYNPDDDRLLIYNVDVNTLPQNTLGAVTGIVDPRVSGPNAGLPAAVNGQRYLILDNIGHANSRLIIPGEAIGGTSPLNDITFTAGSLTPTGGIATIADNSIAGKSISTPNTRVYGQVPIVTESGSGELAYADVSIGPNTQRYSSTNTVIAITHPGSDYQLSDPTVSWGNVVANANDIIEYNAEKGEWFVAFDSSAAAANDTVEYMTNLRTNIQYRFTRGTGWIKSYEGWYASGDWSIVI